MTLLARRRFLDEITLNRLIFLCAIYAAIALLFSLLHEHYWEVKPCNLCNLQRAPLIAILLISGFGILTRFKEISVVLIQIFFFANLVLASYHLMIQLGLVADPCLVPKGIKNLADFRRMLDSQVPCSKITWKIFEAPVSAYNVGLSIIFLIITIRNKK